MTKETCHSQADSLSIPMNENLHKYLSAIGRKGGSVKSAAKTAAARANASKPRPKARNHSKKGIQSKIQTGKQSEDKTAIAGLLPSK